MRKKRNNGNVTFSTDGYIKKFFGTEIGRILVPSNRNIQNCEIPYVSHEEAENILGDCLIGDPNKDKFLVFTGLTGSGKTTILRHVFKLEINANKPFISNNIITIPIDFNRSQSSAQDAILSSLRTAVDKIVKKYGIDYPTIENEEFIEYIEERRPDFLHLDARHTHLTPSKEKMDVFLEKLPTAFASCQLQYTMDHPQCNLQLVVLIIDNIEAFWDTNTRSSKYRYLAPVVEAFKLAECIDHRQNPTNWCFNMVISCRHHIWRIMKGEFTDNSHENSLLQSYVTTERPYDLANPIDVNAIIQMREKVFSRKQRDPSKWQEASKVVNTILDKMENCIGDFVMQLELKDLRKSMSRMQELILHKGLQKKSDEDIAAGAFQIDSIDQFDLTRVNLIRTIGLGNQKYYTDLNSIIPNLLFNNKQIGMELYPLLTLSYFLIRCGFSEPAWDNPISISEFYLKMKLIFQYDDSQVNDLFGPSIQFLIQHRLILRSADQPQEEVPGLSIDEIKKIEYVYVSGSSIKLWSELGKSSALFQLYLDDIWLDEDSDYFGDNGNDIEHCVKYLKELLRIERYIYTRAKNLSIKSEEEYIESFGIYPICLQLVNGLISSLETIIASGDLRLSSRVKKANEALIEAKILSEELVKWTDERQKLLK